eukprot:CAMPEP_0197628994 /NCGR_PEP_ID=MMETSP1338-20131121/7045_1 /TAXON_ID=43686 ORGANISM="Pelagodinium beii, Strain RCC1491" /NCGR_SAMPLE_ID=MMETSP1338 /ASSEMBLY_ACC=CAM_ASM_000754 /LENGTH=663 /DNA_ID=CAMNT_0043200001 /DNA_START=151 /DNA_END=2142 /DNA_ORIENTATION=-
MEPGRCTSHEDPVCGCGAANSQEHSSGACRAFLPATMLQQVVTTSRSSLMNLLLLGLMLCMTVLLCAGVNGKQRSHRRSSPRPSLNVARRWVKDLLDIFVAFPWQGAQLFLHWLIVVPFQALQGAGLAIDAARKARLQQQLLDEAYAISARQQADAAGKRSGSSAKQDQRHSRPEIHGRTGSATKKKEKKKDQELVKASKTLQPLILEKKEPEKLAEPELVEHKELTTEPNEPIERQPTTPQVDQKQLQTSPETQGEALPKASADLTPQKAPRKAEKPSTQQTAAREVSLESKEPTVASADSAEWQHVQREAHGRSKGRKEKLTSWPVAPPSAAAAKATSRKEQMQLASGPSTRDAARRPPVAAPPTPPQVAQASPVPETTAATNSRLNPWKAFTDRIGVTNELQKELEVSSKDQDVTPSSEPLSTVERPGRSGNNLPPPPMLPPPPRLTCPSPLMDSSMESCSTAASDAASEADAFFKNFISDAKEKDKGMEREVPKPPVPSMLPPRPMRHPSEQAAPVPGLASLGTFCGWSTGGTGGTADIDYSMIPAQDYVFYQMYDEDTYHATTWKSGQEDEVDLQMEAMVEDLAGKDGVLQHHQHLVEDAITKVDAARTALSKVLTESGMRRSAPSFVPGQMWMDTADTAEADTALTDEVEQPEEPAA